MVSKKLILTIAALLIAAAACIYTILPHKPETPLIGSWEAEQSILNLSTVPVDAEEIIVSFAYDMQGAERRYSQNTSSKTVSFLYEVDGTQLIVWQGAISETYTFSIGEDSEPVTMTLTKADGTEILLTRISEHP